MKPDYKSQLVTTLNYEQPQLDCALSHGRSVAVLLIPSAGAGRGFSLNSTLLLGDEILGLEDRVRLCLTVVPRADPAPESELSLLATSPRQRSPQPSLGCGLTLAFGTVSVSPRRKVDLG